mmetsp:Transcript_4039/g.10214  ORF Transcript_4039/g.10214 Transcript_4039/m.10214 type:complete len:446 (-) Transcript_4039:161-1498(-)
MVLVSQPTHPAFWTAEERHEVCSTCKSKFTCAPPTRQELMESFTGPEIAALIAEGKIIAAHPSFTEVLEKQIEDRPLPSLIRSYTHWIRGVYLITKVEENDDRVTVPIQSARQKQVLMSNLDDDLSVRMEDRTFRVGAEGSLSDVPADGLRSALEALEPPFRIVLVSTVPPTSSDDTVAAVNLTRPVGGPEALPAHLRRVADGAIAAAAAREPGAQEVELTFFAGGPCDADELVTCLVLGGPRGYTIVRDLRSALELAARRAAPDDSKGGIAAGQAVRLAGLQSRVELNGQEGMACTFDANLGRWAVRLRSGDAKNVRPANLEPLDGSKGRVWAFLGEARWTRAQLLGEIARGSWGLCSALVGDLLLPPPERRAALELRLAYAPVTEMSEDFVKEAQARMDRLRQEAREAIRHADAPPAPPLPLPPPAPSSQTSPAESATNSPAA